MLDNPEKEWRRLTELYADMYDEQLQELAADFGNLTEMAQQVLRDEMKKRGLSDPTQPKPPQSLPVRFTAPEPGEAAGEEPAEFTWKTDLCACEDWKHAWQIREALRLAGIESWIDSSSRYGNGGTGPRVQVAADQLDEARQVIAQPIPQEIIDESNTDIPEFEAPHCPQCGTQDAVLISVEPVNTWSCEACGREWSEAVEPGK